jgi:DNA-binding Lrp family transcriptional regulator
MLGNMMVVQAYVLVNVESGFEDEVIKQLRTLNITDEAYVSFGLYDMVVKVKKDTLDELKKLVSSQIRAIDKVRSTLTLVIM